jgi:hypothetical protein
MLADSAEHAFSADTMLARYRLVSAAASGQMACLGNPDPGDMKVYCPEGKETFDDDEATEEAPS